MRDLGRRLAFAALGGACLAASFPPLAFSPQTFLVFVAPALLLHALRGAPPSEALLAGWIFGLVGVGIPGRWVVPALVSSGHPIVAVLVLGGLALPATLFSLLHAFAEPRLSRLGLVVLVPALWIAIEWVGGICPVVPMSLFALGDALGASPSLCQSASIVGVHGLSLLVLVSALLLEAAIQEARTGHAGRAIVRAVAGAGLPTIVWELGFFVLVGAVPIEAAAHGSFSAILVQSTESVEQLVALSVVGMRRAALDLTPKVDAIVWPEGAWPDSRPDPFDGGELAAPLKAVARLTESTFIFGCHREANGRRFAALVAVDPRGKLLAEYHERAADPYLDAPAERGDRPVVFQAGRYRVGLALGNEASHPELLRDLLGAGAETLVIAGADPPGWPLAARIQQVLQYPIRACELRCPIARDATAGITVAMDELGRPYRELHTERAAILLSRLRGPGEPTLYLKGGYRLPHVAAIVAAAAIVLLLFRKRRPAPGQAVFDSSRSGAASRT